MKQQVFNCGCSFDILQEFNDGRQPLVDFNIEKVNYNCPATWKIFEQGLTAGIFQLESNLGKHYSKELKPTHIEHITALGAILRPGCLDARSSDGISMTQRYCLRKNGKEVVESYHPVIDKILGPTYGILVYQEQYLQAAALLADFTEGEQDSIRKAAGKKSQEEMSKIMKLFKEKALKKGAIDETTLDKLIDNIKATARYSFNKSHSASYGLETYQTAYIKAHFPLAFFTAKLVGAKFKVDEETSLQQLINEAKLFNIEIKLPDIRDLRKNFYTNGHYIRFGLHDILHIGESIFQKIKNGLAGYQFTTFFDFALKGLYNLPNSSILHLITAGALDSFNLSRTQMLEEYKALMEFNKNELKLMEPILEKEKPHTITSLFDLVVKPKKEGGVVHDKNRLRILKSLGETLKNPIITYKDSPIWMTYSEEELLGYPITYQKIDSCDVSQVNTSCKDFLGGKKGFMILGVDVKNLTEKAIGRGDNKGKKFVSLRVTDASGMIDAVAWPEIYEKYKEILTERNSIIIQGEKGKKGDTFVIQRAWQAK